MTNANPGDKNGVECLQMRVRQARELVRQSERKVEAIEAAIREIEQFRPKIRVMRPRAAEPASQCSPARHGTWLPEGGRDQCRGDG